MRVVFHCCVILGVLMAPRMLSAQEKVPEFPPVKVKKVQQAYQAELQELQAKYQKVAEALQESSSHHTLMIQPKPGALGVPTEALRSPSKPMKARVNFISFDGLKANEIKEITEDMNVMNHLLIGAITVDKPVVIGRRGSHGYTMSILSSRSGHVNVTPVQVIDGVGAIFEYSVSFPFESTEPTVAKKSKPAEKKPAEKKSESEPTSVWTKAFNELQGVPERAVPSEAKPSNVELIEQIANRITKVLGEVGNLRHLKNGETVTVIVNGARSRSQDTSYINVLALKVTKSDAAEKKGAKPQVKANLWQFDIPTPRSDTQVPVLPAVATPAGER